MKRTLELGQGCTNYARRCEGLTAAMARGDIDATPCLCSLPSAAILSSALTHPSPSSLRSSPCMWEGANTHQCLHTQQAQRMAADATIVTTDIALRPHRDVCVQCAAQDVPHGCLRVSVIPVQGGRVPRFRFT